MPVRIFISYAREDSTHLRALGNHLRLMQRQGILDAWHEELVVPGQDLREEVKRHLSSAQVIILLVSSGYFSDPAYDQMERATQRSQDSKVSVIPVFVRPCLLQGSWVDRLSKLPDNGQAVTTWTDPDAAWANVAAGIRRALVALNSTLR